MRNKVVITKTKDCNWLSNEKYGELKWKLLIDSTTKMTSDISVGLVKIKPHNGLALHRHSPKELYIIKKGEGLLLKPDKNESLKAGDVVFIPENAPHAARNTGKTSLLIYWIFPKDSWEDVKYNFIS